MRITFVVPHAGLAGGIRVIAIYANRLHLRGHKVTVVSLPRPRKGLREKFELFFREMRWPKDHNEPSHFDGLPIQPTVIESVRPIVDDDLPDADVVIATFWKTGPWVQDLSPKKGVKAIFLQGYETSLNQWSSEIDSVWRLPLHKIVISQWLVKLAQNRFHDSNVSCILNSVETDKFNAPPRMKQSVPTVGFLYGTLHLKGADICLAALKKIRNDFGNLRVIAFGAEQISSALPLPDWIEFHHKPQQERIREIYSNCDVWLCGSRQEGFHLPPLEAMACRCPVVSTRVGGPQDIIEDGVNGFLVNVDDYLFLAERLQKVFNMSEKEWRQMSNSALATATQYTWDDATDLFERTLNDLASATSVGQRIASGLN